MQFKAFSEKQRQVLTWWCDGAGTRDREAIICDGAVRSGKTLCMGLSFFCWAMRRFGGEKFALCGKTVSALRRNLLSTLLPALASLGSDIRKPSPKTGCACALAGRKIRFTSSAVGMRAAQG